MKAFGRDANALSGNTTMGTCGPVYGSECCTSTLCLVARLMDKGEQVLHRSSSSRRGYLSQPLCHPFHVTLWGGLAP